LTKPFGAWDSEGVPVFVGTSGWQYKDWRGRLYPEKLPQSKWLEHYSANFETVEVNNTFYRLPEVGTFKAWQKRTPEDFVFAVKASRFITHIRRLRDSADGISLFMERASKLGKKLGPVLLQLPPNLRADLDALDETLSKFRKGIKVVVEFRHDSWFTEEVKSLLTEHEAAFCLADRESKAVTPIWRTASWAYIRFHSGTATPPPCYGRGALQSWAGRLGETWDTDAEIYAYFNNDTLGCAVRDARTFARAAERQGFEVSRVPA
jgi:uncharacterized protein YecE (DUF72 family)